MEKQFNEKESLTLIQEMIENSKARLGESSFYFLLWGWLVLISSLAHFALLLTDFKYPFLPWPVMMFGGGIIAGISGYRKRKRTKVTTHLDSTMKYLWISFGIMLLFILISASYGKISWEMSNILIIALYGMGTFASGGIIKFNPLIIGGIACWLIAIASLFIAPQYTLLSIALSIVIAYLIPGYLLKSKEKLQNHV